MQTDWNELYRMTAKRTGKSEERYKQIGNLVFKAVSLHINKPKSLIIKLKGVGKWYLRRNRIEHTVRLFPPDFDRRPTEDLPKALEKFENKVETYNIFKERILDYNEYVADKKVVREIRNKTQKLLEPKNEE